MIKVTDLEMRRLSQILTIPPSYGSLEEGNLCLVVRKETKKRRREEEEEDEEEDKGRGEGESWGG